MRYYDGFSLPIEKSDFEKASYVDLNFFSKFRWHPGFSNVDLMAVSITDAELVMETACSGFVCMQNRKIMAIIAVVDLPWETDFFGTRMGRLHVFCSPGMEADTLLLLTSRVIKSACEDHGFCHLSVDIDIDDYGVLNCLIKNGFEVMDLKRTYFTNILESGSVVKKGMSFVRSYKPDDLSSVEAILNETCFETRFTRDKFLEKDRANKMYREWFHRIIDEAGKSSNVVVFERHGRVVACGGIGEFDFGKYGLNKKLRTGSIYACSSLGVGAYGPVLYRLTEDALLTHGLVETTVSLNNYAAIRVVEGVRPNRSVTTYCLRKHCDTNE
jgi:hypothetical protein